MKRLIIASVALSSPLHAEETRTLRVVNDTSAAVNQLFVSGRQSGKLRAKVSGIFGAPEDEQDRLDAQMLPRGGSIVVTLNGNRCHYAVRAVLEDGRTYADDDVDVCAGGRWAIASGTRR